MSLFSLSAFLIFCPSALDPRHSVTVAMGGRCLLIGVAPHRKQLTVVQEVDNEGHTELSQEKRGVCVSVCVYVYIYCVSVNVYSV